MNDTANSTAAKTTADIALDTALNAGLISLKNRLVMPPMQTNKSPDGHVTDEAVTYYKERALFCRPGLIITEHSCVAEAGRASAPQLSIADDARIEEHRRLTEAIHEGGSRTFAQLNYAGSGGSGEQVSAGDIPIPLKKDCPNPRPLTVPEIREIEKQFAAAADRALRAGYDGIELHCAHSYLLNQFYSPITNNREDDYGGNLENRLRILLETVQCVREVIGPDVPLAVRLGGADYLPGGATEEDAVRACVMLEEAGVNLLDISGGMCFFTRAGHPEPGFFSSMTEKIKNAVSVPVILTGGIEKVSDAERLLKEGKADLIGVGRALLKDAHWRENA